METKETDLSNLSDYEFLKVCLLDVGFPYVEPALRILPKPNTARTEFSGLEVVVNIFRFSENFGF